MKRIVHSCSWWAFLLVLLPLGFPLPTHADGGAPNLAYVAGTTPGISVIDVARQQVSRTLAVPGSPQTVLLSPDGRFLYVTQPALGQVSVLAAQTGQTICTAQLPGHPTQLALNWDGTALYTASSDATTATELDTGTCAVRETWETHAPVFGLALATLTEGNTLQTQVWVAGATSLSIFDAHGQVLDNIPIPAGPQFLCLPNGLTAYVTTRQGTVLAVDITTHHILPPLLTGGVFGSMDYDAITGEIYVPDAQHQQIDVLTPVLVDSLVTSPQPARVLHVSSSPQAIAITSDGQLGFVALRDGQVAMLDLPGRRMVKTIPVGGSPHFVVTGLYPPPGALPPPPRAEIPWFTVVLLVTTGTLLVGCLLLWWVSRRRSKDHPSTKTRETR